ncbi:MAG: hypothetical protein KF861_18250, partial [Planctomycetaceae bacterium]|nr:hypothetical protein [Planctomycetaceae bacterium]
MNVTDATRRGVLRAALWGSVLVVGLVIPAFSAAEAPTRDQAVDAMHRAVQFFRTECSAGGGYVYRLSADLTKREGEGKVGRTTAWVEPPGTPAVGMAYLEAYRLTQDPVLLEAAMDAAGALVQGQLVSGGWLGFIDFDATARAKYAYRTDNPEVQGRNNWTTFDDDKTQSATRFLVQLDQTLGFKDQTIHRTAMTAVETCLESQYPNGAWPQGFDKRFDPARHPVLPATFPDEWPREYPGRAYRTFYTLNDNTIADVIATLFEAWDVYGDQRYFEAARRGGDFIILAQLPEPQPGWAQQYDPDMHPIWARKFEPAAITGGESQGAMRTLMAVYRRTGDPRYLEPIPRALAYYRSILLPDGRLARFYELKTNRPLYFTKDYRLTYDDSDLPTHYSFKSTSRLDAIEAEYERLRATPNDELSRPQRSTRPRLTTALAEQAAAVLAALDERGAWVESGRMSYQGEDDDTRRIIQSSTFSS